jgi:hypothetical protein
MPLKFIEGEEWWEVLVYENPYETRAEGHTVYDIPEETLARWNEGFKAFFALQREMMQFVTGKHRLPFFTSTGPGGPDVGEDDDA